MLQWVIIILSNQELEVYSFEEKSNALNFYNEMKELNPGINIAIYLRLP